MYVERQYLGTVILGNANGVYECYSRSRIYAKHWRFQRKIISKKKKIVVFKTYRQMRIKIEDIKN